MRTVHSIAELRQQLAAWRAAGERIAFAPTMGNLHAGHIDLITAGQASASKTVASIFVNPLQFGEAADLERYPRTLAADAEKLAAAGCALLFAPSVESLYPNGLPLATTVAVGGIAATLEGEFRPGHFEGVATVVNILFNLVQPDVALFGEKDWQQLAVIRRMVADLHLPISVQGVATRRESNGLAMSSRNQFLSVDERQRAGVIYATLMTIAHELAQGSRDFSGLELAGQQALSAHGLKPQYVAIRSSDLSAACSENKELVVLTAVELGITRLIDNLSVRL